MMRAMTDEMKDVLVQFEKRITSAVNNGFDRVDVRLTNLENRLGSLEVRTSSLEETVHEIQEDLRAGLKAIDQHALQLFDHHKRIGRLEKRFA